MLSIRRVKTKSGSIAIQVVVYEGHKTKIIKHIGSGKKEEEISLLYQKAQEFIKEESGQISLFPESELTNEEVIARYHSLWRIEQSFRMSKNDLETRPIFHHKEDAIRAHVLICFVALIIQKYLELTTQLSLQKIRDLIWNVTETLIQDKLTKKVFTFSSPTKDIMNSPLVKLVKLWKLLPH